MASPSKTLPPNAIIVEPSGRATIPFSNFLNSLTQNANAGGAGAVTTAPGSGLTGGGLVANGISLSIAPNGVANQMIRQSTGYSVIGRYAGTTGDVADITATADNRVLARIGGVLAFYDISLLPGAGSVTSVSVVTANGFSGTVATATTTPAITLSYAGAALTKTDDTNVTLTLGGTPASALLQAASLTLGWTGQLSPARGGTGIGTYAVGDILYASATTPTLSKLAAVATGNALISGGTNTAPSWGKIGLTTHVSGTLPIANGGTNQTSLGDITRTNDTNVTLTLGGTPTGAVITSTSFTLGWTGTLAVSRGGTGGGTASGTLLDNISGFSATGTLVRTGSGTYAFRTLTGTANEITVTNGDGVSGNQTFSLPAALTFTGKTITGGTFNDFLIGTGSFSSGVAKLYGSGALGTVLTSQTTGGATYGMYIATEAGNVALAIPAGTENVQLAMSGKAITPILQTVPVTVATLPAAATAGAGARGFVTDATATTFASIVAGSGANGVPVYSDGSNWRIG